MIDLALHYAKTGWPVFPLTPGGKEPAIPKRLGGCGCLDATLDIRRIESWWTDYPNANVGVATGRISGLLVIDVDPRKTTEWLASVNELALPETFTVRTWSRGYHIYLALPQGSPISIGANLLPGIDWRGNGGYVVGAGSIVGGVTYEICRNVPIMAAPASLIERLDRQGKGPHVAAVAADGTMIIPDGERNQQLFRMGSALRRFGVELAALSEALRAINIKHCAPPLPENDIHKIAQSCMRYAPESKGAPAR